MTMYKEIENVIYAEDTETAGNNLSYIEYNKNTVTFKDGTIATRVGLTKINGVTIKEKEESLLEGLDDLKKYTWFSLQATYLKELKAAYRAGFRCRNLKPLGTHLEEFERNGTIQLEKIK